MPRSLAIVWESVLSPTCGYWLGGGAVPQQPPVGNDGKPRREPAPVTVAVHGIFAAVFMVMQFACSPIQGALSDRYGFVEIGHLTICHAVLDFLCGLPAPARLR